MIYCETVHQKKQRLSEEQLQDPAIWKDTLKELQTKYEEVHDFKNEKEWLASFDQDAVSKVIGGNVTCIQDICDQPHEDGPFTIRFQQWNGKPDNLDKKVLVNILKKLNLVIRVKVYNMVKKHGEGNQNFGYT